jgi:hypothetical protein
MLGRAASAFRLQGGKRLLRQVQDQRRNMGGGGA